MSRYRICKNEGPHEPDWWTVEYEVTYVVKKGWFKKPETVLDWYPSMMLREDPSGSPYDSAYQARRFKTEAEAQAYIDEAKRPRVHICGEPQ